MSNDTNEGQDPNENLEEVASQTEDEVRAKVIAKFHFDEEVDGELIDDFTKDKIESNKKLSTAIKQKIIQREEKEELAKKLAEYNSKQETPEAKKVEEARTSEDDLMFLASSGGKFDKDDITNLKDIAKMKGISIEEASENPLFKNTFEKKQVDKQKEGAGLPASSRSMPVQTKGVKEIKPGMTEEEHKEAWRKDNEERAS